MEKVDRWGGNNGGNSLRSGIVESIERRVKMGKRRIFFFGEKVF